MEMTFILKSCEGQQKLSVSHSQDNGRLLAVSATYCACGQLMNHNDGDIRMK